MTSRTTPSAVDTPTDKPADSPARQVTIPNGQNPDMRTPAAPASDQLDQSATPTQTERAWALAIRKAARAADDISDLSDFEYLQHAILARDNIPSALSRIRRMQALRKRYHVDNVDATEALRFLNLTMHGIHCSTGTTSSGHRVTVMDYSKLEPSKLVTEQDWRLFICGTLYYFDAVHCDLDAVRHGLIYAAKCRSVRWTNFSIEAERRMNSVYQSTYPVRIHQVVLLDAPKIVRSRITTPVYPSSSVKASWNHDSLLLHLTDEWFFGPNLLVLRYPAMDSRCAHRSLL